MLINIIHVLIKINIVATSPEVQRNNNSFMCLIMRAKYNG